MDYKTSMKAQGYDKLEKLNDVLLDEKNKKDVLLDEKDKKIDEMKTLLLRYGQHIPKELFDKVVFDINEK